MPHIVCNRKPPGLTQWENRNDEHIYKSSANVIAVATKPINKKFRTSFAQFAAMMLWFTYPWFTAYFGQLAG